MKTNKIKFNFKHVYIQVNLFIEIIKDHLIAANYFNTTTDEFINSSKLLYVYFMKIFIIFNFFFEVRSVYFNVFAEKSLQFVTKLKEKVINQLLLKKFNF